MKFDEILQQSPSMTIDELNDACAGLDEISDEELAIAISLLESQA